MLVVDYKIPPLGLGTDFSEYERPITFAKTYTNRFRNINGGAERRPGMTRFGNKVGAANLTRLHEHVSNTGVETILTSDDSGNIWRYNVSASAFDSAITGKAAVRIISAQAEDKLIFVNGVDRNFYTDDGGVTFKELRAIITQGAMAGGTNTTTIVDGSISNWIGNTLVSNNDIVYNITRDAYGIVTSVASAALTITAISSATVANGSGISSLGNQAAGDVYQLIDYVDLNIIPQPDGTKDNVATAGPGTTVYTVAVSGVDFSTTDIRPGDFVYNTTFGVNALGQVTVVSANINLDKPVGSQNPGDSLVFFKSAMPIASWIHVHYGRCYYLDARNQRNIVISAPDDPQDVTTYQQTLDSTSYSFGTQQPSGDVIITMATFQKYFVAGGRKNMYIYEGTDPIKDASTSTINFSPVASYPNGVVSRFGLGTNGSDLLHVTTEGVQAINIGNISNTTVQNNASVPVRTAMLNAITAAASDNIQLTFYPRRTWHITKVGDVCYILNTNPTYDDSGQLNAVASWHYFTGKWAQQNHYFVRRNGDLLACGANGLVYTMDANSSGQAAAPTDDGEVITTSLTPSWLRLEEPQRTVRVKQGQYIKPVFESNANVSYTINAVAGFDNYSSDSITVSAGNDGAIGTFQVGVTPIGAGTYAQNNKYPLRWRGEQVQIEFITNSSATPDIITGFSLYGSLAGVR